MKVEDIYNLAKIEDSASLDKSTPVPLYYQLKQYIRGKILNGDWKVDDILPSELAFCDVFSISRPTVRQAINELVTEGSLHRSYRRVLIAKPKVSGSFFDVVQSFNAEMQGVKLAPKTRVLALDVRDNSEAAARLGDSGKQFVHLERLRFADDEPIVWLETFLPYDSMNELLKLDFTNISLYETIEERFNVIITRVDRFFESTVADARDVEIMKVRKGSPICYVKTIGYDQNDKPFEFSIARYRGDKTAFHVSITR